MKSQRWVEIAYHATCAAVRKMKEEPELYPEVGIEGSIIKAFAYGEILEYSEREIAAEMGLEYSQEFLNHLEAMREEFEQQAQTIMGAAAGDEVAGPE